MHPHNAFYIQDLLANALNLLALVIFIEVIVSWLVYMRKMSAYHPLVKILHQVVTPILAPVRRVIPPSMTGGWDISPMIVIFSLQFLSGYLQSH
jgi:YggT family protein